jgi:hypothetical protein
MARDLSRTILCSATGCVKAGTIPKGRGKPNGWRYAEYLVNRGDGRWLIPVEPVAGRDTFLCPRCAARQDAQRRLLASREAVQAQAPQPAPSVAQEAAQAPVEAVRSLPPPGYASWAPEVIADGSGVWCGNALRFETFEEAHANVQDLSWRWMLVRDTRVVPSKDPVNYRYGKEGLVAV